MRFKELKNILRTDLARDTDGDTSLKSFVRYRYFTPGFKYTYHWRLYKYLLSKKVFGRFKFIFEVRLKKYTYKYGIQIPLEVDIEEGLLIKHFGSIFINPMCRIGKNFTISQEVTIGIHKGKVPTIYNNVTIAPGVKVIGGIVISNNVSIGQNSVVIKDVEENSVVAGNPVKLLYKRRVEELRYGV